MWARGSGDWTNNPEINGQLVLPAEPQFVGFSRWQSEFSDKLCTHYWCIEHMELSANVILHYWFSLSATVVLSLTLIMSKHYNTWHSGVWHLEPLRSTGHAKNIGGLRHCKFLYFPDVWMCFAHILYICVSWPILMAQMWENKRHPLAGAWDT